jgi:ribosomal subunit interface protein
MSYLFNTAGGFVKINFHAKGVIVTAKQKALMEKKIANLRKYLKDINPVTVDLSLIDESSPERGGIDQAVHITVILPEEKIFIEEVDDRIMRAFGFALKTLERRLSRRHKKNIDKVKRRRNPFKDIFGAFGRVGGRVGGTVTGTVGRLVPKRRKR